MNPGKGLFNAILYPYYPKRDGDFEKLRTFISNEATPTSLRCASDGKVPLEDSEKLVRRMCENKNDDCCLLQVMKSPQAATETANASVNESCFSKGSALACVAVMSRAKKTTDVLTASTKACDLGLTIACLQKASILYGLKKDGKGAAQIFDQICREKNSGFACYMGYLHADRATKDKLAAAQYLKAACRLGFKYRC